MKFKEWILSESIEINFDSIEPFPIKGQTPATQQEIKEFIKQSLNKYFRGELNQTLQRYTITLAEVKETYSGIQFNYTIMPKGGTPEPPDPNDPMYDYIMKYKDGKTNNVLFKTPKDAIDSIPDDPSLVYRGMSWEEWQFIRQTGTIKSNAGYNIGSSQDNLTFYGNAETAQFYASGFAPMQYDTSKKRPSVIIAIPREHVLSHQDEPDAIPENEFAHAGSLDAKNIKHAWMLAPIKGRQGSFDLIHTWQAVKDEYKLSDYPSEGSRSSPSVSYAIRQLM